jgi:hypothetical protein
MKAESESQSMIATNPFKVLSATVDAASQAHRRC